MPARSQNAPARPPARYETLLLARPACDVPTCTMGLTLVPIREGRCEKPGTVAREALRTEPGRAVSAQYVLAVGNLVVF